MSDGSGNTVDKIKKRKKIKRQKMKLDAVGDLFCISSLICCCCCCLTFHFLLGRQNRIANTVFSGASAYYYR